MDRTVRVDPTTLGANYHYRHLEGSLGYPRPPTLPQNAIGSLCGGVRPDLCQLGLISFQPGLLRLFGSGQGQNGPNPTHQRSNPTLEGRKMISGDSFSRVFVTRPHGKVDTPKSRDPKVRNAGPDESPHSGPYTEER
ncbi:hypothetical protein CRG98_046314 [Punica granatum]|uniref:Uncharacterized protein n=1 Tax=Punica granatum TaxID=22663 RepID=A0A2I0HNK2_PUNGR|nr:hypothetical protein CRG98_046314 [Punica granatum]